MLKLRPRAVFFVAPAPFAHEAVPDQDFLLVWPAARRNTPFQDFLIGAPLQDALPERGILHSQESAASSVECYPQIAVVIRRQRARRMQADFIQHAGKKDYPANFRSEE